MSGHESTLREFFRVQIDNIRSANWEERNEDFRDETSAIIWSMFHGISVEHEASPWRIVPRAVRARIEEDCLYQRATVPDAETFIDWLIGEMDQAIQSQEANAG